MKKLLRKPTKAIKAEAWFKAQKKDFLIHPIYGIVHKQLKFSKYFIIHTWKWHIEKDTNTLKCKFNLYCYKTNKHERKNIIKESPT